jgi:hypothetical protein
MVQQTWLTTTPKAEIEKGPQRLELLPCLIAFAGIEARSDVRETATDRIENEHKDAAEDETEGGQGQGRHVAQSDLSFPTTKFIAQTTRKKKEREPDYRAGGSAAVRGVYAHGLVRWMETF